MAVLIEAGYTQRFNDNTHTESVTATATVTAPICMKLQHYIHISTAQSSGSSRRIRTSRPATSTSRSLQGQLVWLRPTQVGLFIFPHLTSSHHIDRRSSQIT